MRQDLHRIAIADAKQDAANLNAPMRQSIEAIGGGNAKLLTRLPAGVRLGSNKNAFIGGFRMWQDESVHHGIVRTASSK